jgi:hypothetical protein
MMSKLNSILMLTASMFMFCPVNVLAENSDAQNSFNQNIFEEQGTSFTSIFEEQGTSFTSVFEEQGTSFTSVFEEQGTSIESSDNDKDESSETNVLIKVPEIHIPNPNPNSFHNIENFRINENLKY